MALTDADRQPAEAATSAPRETPGQRHLRLMFEVGGGGYDPECPHDCPHCGGEGCRPARAL